jgi:hypothetical protein
MYDFGARWYDPVTASFAAVDPVVGDAANPLALNAYSYVSNRPMKMVDPDGRNGVVSGPSGFDGIAFAMQFQFGGGNTIQATKGDDDSGESGDSQGSGEGPFCGGGCKPGHREDVDAWRGQVELGPAAEMLKKGGKFDVVRGRLVIRVEGSIGEDASVQVYQVPPGFEALLRGVWSLSWAGSDHAREMSALVGGANGTVHWELEYGSGKKVFQVIPYGVKIRGARIAFHVHTHPTDGGPPSGKDHETAAKLSGYGIASIVISRDGSIYLVGSSASSDLVVGSTAVLE